MGEEIQPRSPEEEARLDRLTDPSLSGVGKLSDIIGLKRVMEMERERRLVRQIVSRYASEHRPVAPQVPPIVIDPLDPDYF